LIIPLLAPPSQLEMSHCPKVGDPGEKEPIHHLLACICIVISNGSIFPNCRYANRKSRMNNMTTNLPAKMVMAMVVLAAAAVEMVVVGNGRRV
jgi:hypothetical protein